jgi:hypothetical protein
MTQTGEEAFRRDPVAADLGFCRNFAVIRAVIGLFCSILQSITGIGDFVDFEAKKW